MTNARNKIAGSLAIISGLLFVLSGYKASIVLYQLLDQQIRLHAPADFWHVATIPVNILAVLAQLGGIIVIAGGLLFLANRVTSGKFLVLIGTGQGIITVIAGLIAGLISHGIGYADSYVISLATTATGIGILISILSRSVAKSARAKPAR